MDASRDRWRNLAWTDNYVIAAAAAFAVAACIDPSIATRWPAYVGVALMVGGRFVMLGACWYADRLEAEIAEAERQLLRDTESHRQKRG